MRVRVWLNFGKFAHMFAIRKLKCASVAKKIVVSHSLQIEAEKELDVIY